MVKIKAAEAQTAHLLVMSSKNSGSYISHDATSIFY